MKVKRFLRKTGVRDHNDLSTFLSGLKKNSVYSVNTESDGWTILYEEALPEVLYTVPVDGATSVTSGPLVWILFDEEITTSEANNLVDNILVYRNGILLDGSDVTMTPTPGGFGASLSGVFATAGAFYHVSVLPTLPFLSGRTLGKEFTFSFKLA